jgi:hypothetical protein
MPAHPSACAKPRTAVSPRLLRVLLPLLVLVTGVFGLYQLFVAGVALRVKSYPFALLYAVMGVAGLAVATALGRTFSRLRGR